MLTIKPTADATNLLSHMRLKAHAMVQPAQPDFSVRFHPSSAKDFQVRTAQWSVWAWCCLENGQDAIRGGARYNFTSPLMVGVANVADSLPFVPGDNDSRRNLNDTASFIKNELPQLLSTL